MPAQFPEWLRRPWPSGDVFGQTKETLSSLRLHTVCQSARCPNVGECWAKGTATVMVLGNTCSRNCSFCSVPSGKPEFDDPEEPLHVALAIHRMGLKHAVVTTVVRDDLPDGGATHIAATIRAIHVHNPGTSVEILVSDFSGDRPAIRTVLGAAPEVFCHNIETVERLYPKIRDRRFEYRRALGVLAMAAAESPRVVIKSALMVGHGETPDDVAATLRDLREAGCEAICIGQYLRPTLKQAGVVEFVHPDRFREYEALAYEIGFEFAVAGPFVRSSYRSEEILESSLARRKFALPVSAAAG